MISNEVRVRELAFHAYNQRQNLEISAERILETATKVVPAGNFTFNGRSWVPNEYMGYAVVSMLNANPGNENLAKFLKEIQSLLNENLQPVNGFYMLPPDSFHQTVANTLSADRFKTNILNAGIEPVYPEMVKQAFDKIPMSRLQSPIKMRATGLGIMGTAIGMLFTFDTEADYNRIMRFRAGLYDNEKLAAIDVKMTRPFIGHITLAYAEQKLNKNQKEHLATIINEINEYIRARKNYFLISKTGLRRYDHLAEFKNADNYPVYHFTA
ncbi:hypothetical protein [Mucilaginibacter polytrichastri]|uniref:DUF1868 domain-containing protein n=1 Tax=Mucilaginibacter polytrichastri TaxID=1302689 RepID=A0A1Q5ZZE8_9SPHI|nr:hypothetical protein [Mucilaginibacter polytrichastri]OKS87145.1 hypothetical protein RG47T_2604 [Mucilaginibacter polytrichastri]SFS88038.1 hypothetical protein SAMN04487890_105212 [Mucilaginibacter polytrichastri]